jgi:hypothetical protein
MKKLSRLAALAALLSCTAWSTASGPAYGLLACEAFNGLACSSPGQQVTCLWRGAPGTTSVCTCTPTSHGNRWACPM